jgi:hypothetical protein
MMEPQVDVIICERMQLPAGQGFFHAADVYQIGAVEHTYRYIYDCGTSGISPPGDFQLASSFERLATLWQDARTFDTMFVSHLHRDHVSGLRGLFARFRPQTIVMPYTDVSERLIAAAQSLEHIESSAIADEVEDLDFYHRLIANPGGFLSEFAESGVVLVRHTSGLDDEGTDGPDRPFWDAGSVFVSGRISEVSDRQDIATGRSGQSNWILRPYIDEASSAQKRQFMKILSPIVDVPLAEIETWLSITENVLTVLVDHIKELSSALRDDKHDFNVTSMSLYSGPGRSFSQHHHAWSSKDRHSAACSPDAPGWIGAGDAKLKNRGRRERFLAHFGELSTRVATFALPHHGSKNNHDSSLLSTFRPRICVVGSGYIYGNAHPHPTVEKDIQSRSMDLVVVDNAESWLWERTFSFSSRLVCFHDTFPELYKRGTDPRTWAADAVTQLANLLRRAQDAR